MLRKMTTPVAAVIVVIGLVMAACATPNPEVKVEEKIVKETVIVEKVVEVPAQKATLNLYNVAGYTDFYKARVVAAFREAYPDIEVNYVSGKWDELLSKLKVLKDGGAIAAGENEVHLIITGVDGIAAYSREGFAEEILPAFKAELPNVEKLAPPGSMYVDIWGGYAVPAHIDYYPLILRNPDVVPDPITDLDDLKNWIQAHPGRFQHGRPARSGPGRTFVLGIAAAFGEDLEKPAEWTATWDYLKEIDPYIVTYTDGTGPTIRGLAGGENDMIPLGWGWQADLKHFLQIPVNTAVDTAWTPIQFADPHGFVIPIGVPETSLDAALKFINFELSDEVQALMGEVVHYPATIAGWEAMPDKYKNLTSELMGGKAFPEFVEQSEFSPLPSAEALSTLFDEWDNRIGATHEYKGS